MDGLNDPTTLVALLYQAVWDAAAWSEALKVICQYLPCDALTLFLVDLSPALLTCVYNAGFMAETFEIYQRDFAHHDPRWRAALARAHQRVWDSSLSDFESEHEKFCQWYRRYQNRNQFTCLNFSINEKFHAILLADFAEEHAIDRELFKERSCALIPYLKPALRSSLEHNAVRLQLSITENMMDRICAAIAVLDDKGRLLHYNSELDRILESGDLQIIDGRLSCNFRPSQKALEEFIDRLIQSDLPIDNPLLMLNRRSGGRPYTVRASSLPLSNDRASMVGQVWSLVITDGDSCNLPGAKAIGAVFKLSERQAELTRLLASGVSLSEAAVTMGVKEKTARTHLEAVLRKTRTRRQSELVCLVHQSCGSINF